MRRMKRNSKKFFLAGILFPFLIYFPSNAPGQVYPDKPITIYCGFEAGATTDLTARTLVNEVSKELGVPVVVENKPGGGSTVAAGLLASKKPDGYTLGIISTTALVTTPILMKMSYDPFKDFTYILSYGRYSCAICVRQESPFKNLRDLLEYARKNPEKLSYGATIMAPTHLATEFLAKQANIKFKLVPFKGGAPAATALLGGHVDFTAAAGIHRQYVKQGLFRMLAVINSEERDPEFPDVPTLTELGYKDVPPPIYIFLAPKGLPDPIFKKLDAAFRKGIYSPEFRKTMDNLGIPFVFRDRQQLEKQLEEEYKFFAKILKEFGLVK